MKKNNWNAKRKVIWFSFLGLATVEAPHQGKVCPFYFFCSRCSLANALYIISIFVADSSNEDDWESVTTTEPVSQPKPEPKKAAQKSPQKSPQKSAKKVQINLFLNKKQFISYYT